MPLDFQVRPNDQRWRRKLPPDFLSRRIQYRLMALLGSLFLLVFLLEQARHPEHWRWMSASGRSQVAAERDVDTRLSGSSTALSDGAGGSPLLIAPDAARPAGARTPDAPAPDAPAPDAPAPDAPAPDTPAPPPRGDAAEPLHRAQRDLWSRLLEGLGEENREWFLRGLKAARGKGPLPEDVKAKWPQLTEQLQAGWQDYASKAFLAVSQDGGRLRDDEQRNWLAVIEALKRHWQDSLWPAFQTLGRDETLSASQQAAVSALQETLDAVFLDAVRDSTVFRMAEKDAWFRLFEQLHERDLADLQHSSAGYVGFLQLFQQPAEYRGKLVDVAGTVRLGYYRDAPKNFYGIRGYYVFWLRPTGAKSPIVIYCLEVPEGFPDLGQPAQDGDKPPLNEDVEFTGFFFKRWAYRAQDDTRLAPLILAKCPQWKRPPEMRPANRPPSAWFWTALLGGTGALGVGAAWLCYHLTRRTPPVGLPARLRFCEKGDQEP